MFRSVSSTAVSLQQQKAPQNGASGSSSLLDQPLPPLPSQHQQLDIQSQHLFASGSNLTSLSRKNSHQNGLSTLSRRSSSASNINSMMNGRMSNSPGVNLAPGDSSLTMSLIPAPPQILRKRPEIVRPQYKFALDQCEESIRRQQELISNRRNSQKPYQSHAYSQHYGLSSSSSGDYYFYLTKSYFGYQQKNSGSSGRGSASAECFVAPPRLPFDSEDEYYGGNSDAAQQYHGTNHYRRFSTTVGGPMPTTSSSYSDHDESLIFDVIGVRIGGVILSVGAMEMAAALTTVSVSGPRISVISSTTPALSGFVGFSNVDFESKLWKGRRYSF